MRAHRTLLAGVALTAGAVIAAAVPALVASGSPARPAAKKGSVPTIVIGSTNFTEQYVVANMYADVLQHAGYKVQLKPNLGTRAAVVPALEHGALDLEPDYAGTLLLYFNPKAGVAANKVDAAVAGDQKVLAKFGATVLQPAAAVDTNVFAVTKATASKYHLTTLSSLAKVASKLTLGAPPECPTNPGCEPGLKRIYGIKFKAVVSTDEAGPITVAALKSGTVQVAEFFSSDGNIVRNHFVQLVDDKHLAPADHVVPVIRKSVDVAGVASALNKLSGELTTTALSNLNIKVDVQHESPAAVARAWLKQKGLI